MIRLTVLYPADANRRFDFDYYVSTHLPASIRLMRPFGFAGWEVLQGVSTLAGDPPDYLCVTHLDFEDLGRLRAGMQAHGAELRADWPNYTDVSPVVTVTTSVSKQTLT